LITHTGRYRELVILGSTIAFGGSILLGRLHADSSRTALSLAIGVIGFGNGLVSPTMLRAAGLAELDPERLRARPSDIAKLPDDQRSTVINAFEHGLTNGFRVVIIGGFLMVVGALFLRQYTLRDSMDEQAEEDSAGPLG
jgi:hypothetical protein